MKGSKKRLIIGTLWPSFWMACIMTIVFFTAFTPSQFAILIGLESISALTAYSIVFFSLWKICAWTAFFSILFSRKPPNKDV